MKNSVELVLGADVRAMASRPAEVNWRFGIELLGDRRLIRLDGARGRIVAALDDEGIAALILSVAVNRQAVVESRLNQRLDLGGSGRREIVEQLKVHRLGRRR